MGKEIVEKVLLEYPETISHSKKFPATEYRLNQSLYALHGAMPDELRKDLVTKLEQENIALLMIPDSDFTCVIDDTDKVITAVYQLNESNTSYVPTGRIFIRLTPGNQVMDIASQLEEIGFKIIDIPKYATYSAWLVHKSGKIYKALTDFKSIQKIKQVEHIEPQMLNVRSLR